MLDKCFRLIPIFTFLFQKSLREMEKLFLIQSIVSLIDFSLSEKGRSGQCQQFVKHETDHSQNWTWVD